MLQVLNDSVVLVGKKDTDGKKQLEERSLRRQQYKIERRENPYNKEP